MARRRGSALVAAVLVMSVLIVLAAASASTVRQRVRGARTQVARLQGLYLAQAGVRLAEATLRADDTTVDSLDEEWALLGGGGAEAIVLEPGWFRVQIIDAASRVNINTADQAMLLHLPGLDEAMADAIMDWREAGDTPRPNGAKADYYESLPTPYTPRGGPFETTGELMLVRGVTPALFYGPPQPPLLGDLPLSNTAPGASRPLCEWITVSSQERNVSADGQPRINLNTATEEQLVSSGGLSAQQAAAVVQYRNQRGTFQSVGELLAVPGLAAEQVRTLLDRVTVTDDAVVRGKVNVNTAPVEVLASVPGIDLDAAEAIVAARETGTGPFQSIGDLLAPDLLDAEAFRQAAGHLSTRSSAFLVRAMGRVPESPVVTALEVVVERTEEGTRITSWQRVDRAPGWIAWGWPRETPDPAGGEAIRW